METIMLLSGEKVKAKRLEQLARLNKTTVVVRFATLSGQVVCVCEGDDMPYVDPDKTPEDYTVPR